MWSVRERTVGTHSGDGYGGLVRTLGTEVLWHGMVVRYDGTVRCGVVGTVERHGTNTAR